jgi:single-strand DNA-binding protein
MQTTVTLVGNVVNDPSLRYVAGAAVTNFRMAAQNGFTDKRTGQYVERAAFISVAAWRVLGENVATSVHRGQPVVVIGKLRQREFEREGQKVTVIEVDADFVGHDLTRGTASFVRTRRGPQTADLARAAAGLGDPTADPGGATPRTDTAGWAVPGLPTSGPGPAPGAEEVPADVAAESAA